MNYNGNQGQSITFVDGSQDNNPYPNSSAYSPQSTPQLHAINDHPALVPSHSNIVPLLSQPPNDAYFSLSDEPKWKNILVSVGPRSEREARKARFSRRKQLRREATWFDQVRLLLFFAIYNVAYVNIVDKFQTRFDLAQALLYDNIFCLQIILIRYHLDLPIAFSFLHDNKTSDSQHKRVSSTFSNTSAPPGHSSHYSVSASASDLIAAPSDSWLLMGVKKVRRFLRSTTAIYSLLVLGICNVFINTIYNMVVSFIDARTLLLDQSLFIQVAFSMYVYLNNFFMTTISIALWRKLRHPNRVLDAHYPIV